MPNVFAARVCAPATDARKTTANRNKILVRIRASSFTDILRFASPYVNCPGGRDVNAERGWNVVYSVQIRTEGEKHMKDGLFRAMMVAAIIPAIAAAQHNASIAGTDLSGTWAGAGGLAAALKRVVDGKVVISRPDQSRPPKAVSALPSAPAPSYQPQFQAKVKELSEHESKVDPVFYCGKPGVPRLGAPRRIIQLPTELVFLYEDMSGGPYRLIPTDGRGHRVNANPS